MTNYNPYIPRPAHKPDVPYAYSPEAMNEDVKDFVRRNEDEKPYFYKDTKGNVTIGVGFMIPNEEKARELPLKIKGRDATDSEKIDAYRRAKSYLGKNAEAFAPAASGLPDLQLDEGDISLMLDRRLREGVGHLQKQFPDFHTYPRSGRKALQDMEFQVGPTKFKEDVWKNLFPAVRARDWATAAKESRRDIHGDAAKNESDHRNIETRKAFEEADREERSRRRR
ncbi:MAG: hypothetical protein H6868_04790 [Rhodospirillales bacterium]|nr:hypothetical protein [Rhodospirillales bacterium]